MTPKDGDIFTTKCGQKLRVRTGLGPRQKWGYNITQMSVGDVNEHMRIYTWKDIRWSVKTHADRAVDFRRNMEKALVLCPVEEDELEENEFGLVTP